MEQTGHDAAAGLPRALGPYADDSLTSYPQQTPPLPSAAPQAQPSVQLDFIELCDVSESICPA